MAKFLAYTVAAAPAASQPGLQQAERIFGVVPNLQAHLAESPETLSGRVLQCDAPAVRSRLLPWSYRLFGGSQRD
ncbi:hypothetical protein [Paraburkholderia elongata]|uniref:Uncharacterized protein n=1 Tax=Paraburkholderia elongata TaxID=2675747 RepID=A0A972SJ76_9BURK|nr:hypothetical protein [Paraburkholderia elongata]NPT57733.1 hypothetical protein [Paraburkholderia elongata]